MTGAGEPGIVVVPDYAAMSRAAAEIVAATVRAKPEAVLAVPTGSSPLGMFEELTGRVRTGDVDFSRVHLVCHDEYLGVVPEGPNSLTGWLHRAFVGPVGLNPARLRALPATQPDPAAGAARFEAELRELGGLDLAVLGLGPNGHVAYNEPGSTADSRTRVLRLTPESIERAAAYWEGEVAVPELAMTIGVATLLEARQLLLIVSGAGKAEMLRRTLREPMNAAVPASWLRIAGERLTVIADAAAAARLV